MGICKDQLMLKSKRSEARKTRNIFARVGVGILFAHPKAKTNGNLPTSVLIIQTEIEITGLKPGREDNGQPGKTQDRFSSSHQDTSWAGYVHSRAASSVTARRSIESAEPDAGSTSTMVPWSRTSSLATSNGVGQNWMVVSTTRSIRRPRMLE